MSLRSEIRDSPATYGLALSWVVVYALMNWHQGGLITKDVSLIGFGAIRTTTTHLFGDLTWRDFSQGQVWRVVTATFIHFSLAHLVLNLVGMIQLGRMMEEWYGSRLFLAICLTVGGLGNVLGVLMRQGMALGRLWIQAHGLGRILPKFLGEGGAPGISETIPSAGGSTMILGLIGLGLVVGWRSKTRVGLFLRDQMFGFLAFTAVIGIVGMQVIDNYGHAGGAIAGMIVGFFHRKLIHSPEHGIVRRIAFLGSLGLVIASGIGQMTVARQAIARADREVLTRDRLTQINLCKILQERLALLSTQFELIAYERLAQRLAGDTEGFLTSLDSPLDLTPVFELSRYGKLPPLLASGPSLQSLTLFERLLAGVEEVRIRLEDRWNGPEFEDLFRIGIAIRNGPVDSKTLSDFRLAASILTKRSVEAQRSLLAETTQ